MRIRHVFHTPGAEVVAALTGPVERTSRLNAYNAIAAHVLRTGVRRVILDKTAITNAGQSSDDHAELGHDEIALWLSKAGVREVVFLARRSDALTAPLAEALERAGVDVRIAEERGEDDLDGWSPPFTGRW